MKFSNIKAVFFDAADTLFYIREGLGKTYAEPARKYGIDPSPSELKKSFSKHFPSAPPLAFGRVSDTERKDLEKQWWYDVVRNVYDDIGMFNEFDNYFEDLFEHFRKGAWEIFPETEPVLTSLKNKELKLVVVSNFDSRVYDVCRNLGILNYFDDFIISSEAGYAKPSAEIFQLALNRNYLDESECIHIGDNFENDYLCPRSIGMNAVFLDRENKLDNNEIFRIQNLKQITELIT